MSTLDALTVGWLVSFAVPLLILIVVLYWINR